MELASLIQGRKALPTKRQANPVLQTIPQPGGQIRTTAIPTATQLQGCKVYRPATLPQTGLGEISVSDVLIEVDPRTKQKMISVAREEEAKLPALIVEEIALTVASAEELVKDSVCEVNNTNDTGIGSINDPRMGHINVNIACNSCHKTIPDCPGHFGHISLSRALPNPLFFREIISVLICVCNSCGTLLMTETQMIAEGILDDNGNPKYTDNELLKKLEKHSKGLPCLRKEIHEREYVPDKCNPVPTGEIKPCLLNPEYKVKISKETGRIMYQCKDDEKPQQRSIDEIQTIFKFISERDARLMGYKEGAHPSKLIMTVLPVMPPCARGASNYDGMIGPDPFAQIYKDIIKRNNALRNERDEHKRDGIFDELAMRIKALVDNSDGKYTGAGKGVFKSIRELLQGKKALVRGGQMGKRVDFSARTVVGPGANLRLGQVGIPRSWVSIMTKPDKVTNSNREALTQLLKTGRITYIKPGRGQYKGGLIHVNEKIQNTYQLQPGDEVERWLQDGDYADWGVLNRQPTLSRLSMMGHEIVLHDDLNIKTHISESTPFNFDYDGDEMNFHVPQTPEATQEVMEVMSVKQCLMNARSNRPSMGLVYDSLTSAFLLTQDSTKIKEYVWDDCISKISGPQLITLDQRLEKFSVPKYTGKALFSALLPEDFFYQRGDVYIIDGILVNGVIDKKDVGTTPNSIVQILYKSYADGRDKVMDFLSDGPFLLNCWLTHRGFSVGPRDCFPENEEHRKVKATETEKARMFAQARGIKTGDPVEDARREREIRIRLDRTTNIGAKVLKDNLPKDNSLKVMALSGAKGNESSIAQVTTMLGQVYANGERMPLSLTGGKRSLPYFEEGSLDPESRGFISKAYTDGLSPAEYFFSQTATRPNLIDTAINTAEIGHINHQLMKAMEDLKVTMDGSVRNGVGGIVQFAYGDDGFDGGELQIVKVGSKEYTNFINLRSIVGKLNAKYKYYPKVVRQRP